MAWARGVALALCLVFACTMKLAECEGPTLLDQVKKAAGVFVNSPSLVKKHNLEKTVYVTAANYGFLNHLLNFYCFVQHQGMKVLVVALDNEIDKYLHSHNSSSIVSYFMEGDPKDGKVEPGAASFRSKQFNLMTARKKAVVYEILQLGYDVMFSDTDVAILDNPFPYLLWDNVDYVHSLNDPCSRNTDKWKHFLDNPESEGNTGYYFIRSTPRSIHLLEDLLIAMNKTKEMDDQSVFWQLMRSRVGNQTVQMLGACSSLANATSIVATPPAHILRSCVLDPCEFSSGMMRGPARFKALFETLQENDQHAITLHANWLNGNKVKEETLKHYGYWLSKSNTELGHCHPLPKPPSSSGHSAHSHHGHPH